MTTITVKFYENGVAALNLGNPELFFDFDAVFRIVGDQVFSTKS